MINIKVLHMISGNDNYGGGNYVLNLCNVPSEDVTTFLGCIGGGPLYERAVKGNLSTKLFSAKDFVNGNLVRFVHENSIDIVNFHGAKVFFLYNFVHKKLKNISVATIHSDFRYDFMNNNIKKIFYTPLSIMGIKRFSNYICVSSYIKELLDREKISGNKYIINSGIDINKISLADNKQDIKKIYDIEDQDFVYVMIARMHPIKNHENVISAFYKLTKKYSNIKLLFVGDGELESQLKDKTTNLKLDKYIKFCGFQKDIYSFLNVSNVSILASFNEGGSPPLAVLESGALRVPIICSNVCDIKQVVNDQTGFLINPKDIDDIYKKMDEAYKNKDDLKIKGNKLYNVVKDSYSMEIFYKKYYNACSNIIALKNSQK